VWLLVRCHRGPASGRCSTETPEVASLEEVASVTGEVSKAAARSPGVWVLQCHMSRRHKAEYTPCLSALEACWSHCLHGFAQQVGTCDHPRKTSAELFLWALCSGVMSKMESSPNTEVTPVPLQWCKATEPGNHYSFLESLLISFLTFDLWYWGLNSGPCVCLASPLPPEPCPQLFCFVFQFCDRILANFAQGGLKL
jgi:hypothetical protein